MSIFSRKSKANQPQTVAAKPNGQQTYQPEPKHVPSSSVPDGAPVDPIVQRMAIQAASRRRMNSDQPDYSIKSTSSSPSKSNNLSPAPSATQSPLPSPGMKSYDLVQTVSAVSSVSAADADVAPIETMNAGKQVRDPNKLKKKGSGYMSPPQTTPSTTQAPFPAQAMRSNPDLQKVRMPNREYFHSSPHLSRDSGYASVVPASTMDSRTLNELNGAQEAELLRRQHGTNAPLPRTAPGDGAYQERAATFAGSHRQWKDSRSRATRSSGASVDGDRRDSKTYVSRLDPGPASSSFLTSSVVPEISKPWSSGSSGDDRSTGRGLPLESGQSSVQDSEAGFDTRTGAQENYTQKGSRSPRMVEDFARPTPNMSRPRESQPRQVKPEQPLRPVAQTKDRRGSQQSQMKYDESMKSVQSTSPAPSQTSIPARLKDQDQKGPQSLDSSRDPSVQLLPGSFPLTPDTQEKEEAMAPERVPTPPPTELPEHKSPEAIKASTLPTNEIDDSEESSKIPAVADEPATRDLESATPVDTSAPIPPPATDASFEAASTEVSQAQSEFPYLDAASPSEPEKDSSVPSVSALEGFKVNRRGQILDEEGDIIGELAEGEIARCVRQRVNEKGEVVDDSGNIVGRAIPVQRSTISPAFTLPEGRPSFIGQVLENPMTPTEALQPKQTVPAQVVQPAKPAKPVQPARALNDADSDGNTIFMELDASMESQGAPLIDHSDIFSPFAGSPPGGKQENAAPTIDEPVITEKKPASRRHTLRASQEQRTLEESQRQSKWVSRYFDAKTGTEVVPGSSSSVARDFSSGSAGPSTEPTDRPRAMSMLGSTKASEAPRAVLGPTLGSLLETVPDRGQRSQSLSLKTGVGNGSSTMSSSMSQRGSASRSSIGSPSEVTSNVTTQPLTGGARVAGGGMAARARRASQQNLNTKNPTPHPTVRSPLSSIPATPPDNSGNVDQEFRRQLNSPTRSSIQASPKALSRLVEEDDNRSDVAAPAPIIVRKDTTAMKSGKPAVKRKSIFGIPIGKKIVDPAAAR